MQNRRYITLPAVVLIALIGCADEDTVNKKSELNEGLTELEIAANDLTTSLLNRGILLDHDFETSEDGTVSEGFQVVAGHGQAVKSEIAAIVRKLDLSSADERGMKITVIEENDRDIVVWFHKARGL